jgi:hypothetical protein
MLLKGPRGLMTKRILAALALAGVASYQAVAANPDAALCATSTAQFCTEFEEGNLSLWDAVNGSPAPAIVSDPGPFNQAGNHALRLYVPSSLTATGTSVVRTFTGAQKIYARWYQLWETGYDFNAGNHGSGLHAGYRWDFGHSGDRPNGTNWFSTWLEPTAGGSVSPSDVGRPQLYTYYPGMYMDCANPAGSCWGDHFPCMVGPNYCNKSPIRVPPPTPPVLQTNQWYCFEVMLDGGTPTPSQTGANGVQDFWVNGVEIGPWTNLWHRSTATNMNVNLFALMTYYHASHANVGVRYDNVVVSTNRIGCASAAAAPGPPTDLRIIG